MSDEELVRYYSMWLDDNASPPLPWQAELLRRFVKLAFDSTND